MNKQRISILLLFTLALSVVPFGLFIVVSADTTFVIPDYEPVDWQSGLAGEMEMPLIDSPGSYDAKSSGSVSTTPKTSVTPGVGTVVKDWYVEAVTGNPNLILRYIDRNVEIWMAENISFPVGDPRNDDPTNLAVTDEMVEYLATAFNEDIYDTLTDYYGYTADRDGTGTIFELLYYYYGDFSPEYFEWIETDTPQRVILKLINYRDDNYYDPDYPAYVVGFYSPTYTQNYYNRNMIHIDVWRWWQRLGEEGHKWFPTTDPGKEVTRPNLYESTTAHEYQHNIHDDNVYIPESWMNEACSLFAEPLCGYELDAGQIEWFMTTPDNSLTKWGDQGNINILADYGASFLWALYLTSHYGSDFMGRFVKTGGGGLDGAIHAINDLLPDGTDFQDVFHDWRIANLIDIDCGKYGYSSFDFSIHDLETPITVHQVPKKNTWLSAVEEFGETITENGDPTGVYKLMAYGSDYFTFPSANKLSKFYFDGDDIAIYGWTWDDYWSEWWSGAENLYDANMVTDTFTVEDGDILSVFGIYDIEEGWDFGFVQISVDGGPWISLENINTTDIHEGTHPNIEAQLPGITGNNYGLYGILEFDLSADYEGSNVQINLRYMTDWYTTHFGWYVADVWVQNGDIRRVELFDTLIPIYPEADFMVTFVAEGKIWKYKYYYTYDMWIKCEETNYGRSWIYQHGSRKTVTVIVSPIQLDGSVDYEFKIKPYRSKWWC